MEDFGTLEAILFAFGDEGITKFQLQTVFNLDEGSCNTFVEDFKNHYKESATSGLDVVEYGGVLKLVTKQKHHEIIGELLEFNRTRQLSQAALETLAIIAYKQPITRVEIEEIRGVNSDMMCRRLEALDLICEAGRNDTPGRPILYEVTSSFFDVFKLTSLDELPEIKVEMIGENHELFK
ncbi:segregation and condensation protein B [Erysipelothrix larvae]|uniref:Segregation and condensation protein B n=1 Tax=Erysipelothrix larvae TaxID=1514105 RepID=A0A109UGW8_9FIRM|nr:SMC-Scp complex subunit ScpB [Erysipelothrix larvae]AMC93392.1 segregation and condensation protein B [Erysipelothrix larvae]